MKNPFHLIAPKSDVAGKDVAMIDVDHTYTRDELMGRAGRILERLSQDISPGDRCIVSLKNGPDFFAGLVGCWAAGVTPVVLDPAVRSELASAMEMTGAKAVIQSEQTSPFEKGGRGDFYFTILTDGTTAAPPRIPEVADDAPVLFLFTSGSTGKPTLVPKTFRQIEVEVDFIFGLFDGPLRVAGLIPWCHIWGLLSTFFVPLKHGGVCDLRGGISARGVLEHAASGELDFVAGVPVYYQAMVHLVEEGVVPPFTTSCRFGSSSAPLSLEVRNRFRALTGAGITDIFGSTETGGIAYRREDGPWIVQPHVETRIDEDGKLDVRSDSVSIKDDDGFFTISDVVERTEDGFVLLGRQDDVVKIGGRRIALGEITRVIEMCPDVLRAAVITENVAGTLRLLAYVEPKTDNLTSKDIKAFVRSKLADHKVPRTVRIVAELPLTSSGKLDRRKLKELASVMSNTEVSGQGPTNGPNEQVPPSTKGDRGISSKKCEIQSPRPPFSQGEISSRSSKRED
jgi:acyl-coenzyme A synthetase/AMP-(fatty) acid ligase